MASPSEAVRLHTKPVIRRSLAESLLGCVDFIREDSERLAFGQAIHRFAATYTLHLQATKQETDFTAVRGLAADAWARTPGLLQERYAEFMDLCEKFAETHMGRLDTLWSVEETLTHDVGWVILTCTLDRQDRLDSGDRDDDPTDISIDDYKSELGEMNHDFQRQWYVQMRLLTMPSLQQVTFGIDWVRWNRQGEPEVFRRGDLDEWWETTLEGLRHRLETPKGNPTGGRQCEGCAARFHCGSATAVARLVPENDEQADELLADHHRLDEGAKAVWSALDVYYQGRPARVVGPDGNREDVGYMPTLQPSFVVTAPASEVLAWGKKRKRPIDELVKPIAPTRKAERKAFEEARLGEFQQKPPTFKTRIHKPAKGESDD